MQPGARPRLVLVHGSLGNGESGWRGQQELGDAYELFAPSRPGFPPGPPVDRIDFDEHADWLVERLRPGDHLVGHSYGGVVCLFAAARFRDVASLTVLEPPAFRVAAGDPAADEFVRRGTDLWANGPSDPRLFAERFLELVLGRPTTLPDPLPPRDLQAAQALQVERGPWEAEPPLDELAALPFPKLVVSGGWSAAFDAVCDVLERRLRAERLVLPGAGHAPQQTPGFNAALRAFVAR